METVKLNSFNILESNEDIKKMKIGEIIEIVTTEGKIKMTLTQVKKNRKVTDNYNSYKITGIIILKDL